MNDHVASPPAVMDAAEFFARARARLTLDVPAALTDPAAPGARGDLDLDPEMWARAGVTASKPAAVLVPIVARAEPMVLLTQRTQDLSNHAGQVAFPGGKIDPHDESPRHAALREAQEEIGLARDLVEPIGYLDLYLTFSGFRILPLVARVSPGYTLVLNPFEVTEAFEVPLAFLMNVRQSPAQVARLERHSARVFRHAFRRAIHLGRHGGNPAQPVRKDLRRVTVTGGRAGTVASNRGLHHQAVKSRGKRDDQHHDKDQSNLPDRPHLCAPTRKKADDHGRDGDVGKQTAGHFRFGARRRHA